MTVKAQGLARSGAKKRDIMDRDASGMDGIKITKLTDTSFHEWRQHIRMVLALRDLDDMLDEDGKPTDAEDRELDLWKIVGTRRRAR